MGLDMSEEGALEMFHRRRAEVAAANRRCISEHDMCIEEIEHLLNGSPCTASPYLSAREIISLILFRTSEWRLAQVLGEPHRRRRISRKFSEVTGVS